MIWLALFIPIILGLLAYFKYGNKITWWEMLIPISVSVVLIFTIKITTEHMQVMKTEYWGSYLKTATYFEPWDEKVPCQHPIYRTETYSCGTSSAPQTCTRQVFVGYEHPFDVDYHPKNWEARDNIGETYSITQSYWNDLQSNIWKNKHFVNMHRDYYTIDGNAYTTNWDNQFNTIQPEFSEHHYENRIAVSNSIYNYKEVDGVKLGLYQYPDVVNSDCPSVLPTNTYNGELDLKRANALIGSEKQCRVWLLIYKNKPLDTAVLQRDFWKNGNKNELTVCVSIDNQNQVQWCYVFSWTLHKEIEVDIRNYIIEQKTLNISNFAQWIIPEIQQKWQRRHFKEFSYIEVTPPIWVVFLTYIIVTAVSIAIIYWTANNDIDVNNKNKYKTKRNLYY